LNKAILRFGKAWVSVLHYGYKDKRIMIKLIYFTILIFTISLSSIQGAIINVPEDFQTIRNAVGASEDGDTILLQPRRYRETISFNGKEITIASLFLTTGNFDYITSTIIDGDSTGRVVAFSNGEDESSILTGVTITNGASSYGGGIYISRASPLIKYVIIHSNVVTRRGGGIYCTGESSPQFDHVTVANNIASDGQGGIHAFNDAGPIITNSIFWQNQPDEYPQDMLTVSYSDMRNGHAGEGNINLNPRFEDRDNDDFQITWDNYPNNDNSRSRCIDAADPEFENDPDGSRSDMGALYYFQAPDEPVIELSVYEIDFGTVPLDGSREVVIELRNIGIQELEIGDIEIDPDVFSLDTEGNFTIDPRDMVELIVTFSPTDDEEYSGEITIDSNDPDDEVITVELAGTGMEGYYVGLQEGWNMIASPVDPINQDVTNILRNIVERNILIYFKNYQGQFYWPARGFNNVPNWVVEHGYYLKAERDDSLTIIGEFVPVDTPIELLRGFTIASYFPEESADVEIALEGIIDALIIAKDGFGGFYLPEFNWSNMEPLYRGQGYKLKVSEEVNLVWNIEEDGVTANRPSILPPTHFAPIQHGFANMSLLVNSSYIYGNDVELGIYDDSELCLGAIRLYDQSAHGGAIWSGEQIDLTNFEGSELRFRLWDGNHIVEPEFEVIKGEAVYASDEFLVISLIEKSNLPSTLQISSVFPNPFNSSVEISYTLPESGRVNLGIFDLSGRQVVLLASSETTAGIHTTVWQADGFASGVYFVRLSMGDVSQLQRVLLVR